MRHLERHRTEHIGWLRAAVLGANDGLISTASLVVGVAASGAGRVIEVPLAPITRLLFAVFFVVHGLIYLMATAKAFWVAESPLLTHPIRRPARPHRQ